MGGPTSDSSRGGGTCETESARNVSIYEVSVTLFFLCFGRQRGGLFVLFPIIIVHACFMKRISKEPGPRLKRPPKPGTEQRW